MTLAHDELPLPEYDHISIGHLPARIAPLDAAQLQQLIEYEAEHGNRLPVQVVLQHRLEAIENGAEPRGQIRTDFAENIGGVGATGVSPQTTNAPNIHSPSHGDPTNPS